MMYSTLCLCFTKGLLGAPYLEANRLRASGEAESLIPCPRGQKILTSSWGRQRLPLADPLSTTVFIRHAVESPFHRARVARHVTRLGKAWKFNYSLFAKAVRRNSSDQSCYILCAD